MIGPMGSGKTSLLFDYDKEYNDWLKEVAIAYGKYGKEYVEETINFRTLGFNIFSYKRNNEELNIFDLGGIDIVKKYWHHYLKGIKGVIYVYNNINGINYIETIVDDIKNLNNDEKASILPLMIIITKIDLYPTELFSFNPVFLSNNWKRRYITLTTTKENFDINIINWFYNINNDGGSDENFINKIIKIPYEVDNRFDEKYDIFGQRRPEFETLPKIKKVKRE